MSTDRLAAMEVDREIARDWLYGDLVHADAVAAERLRYVPLT